MNTALYSAPRASCGSSVMSGEFGGAFVDRIAPLDGRRQAGLRPVAGKEQIVPVGARSGRNASCAGVAAKVARFS